MKDLALVLRPRFESTAADKAIAKQGVALKSTQTTMDRLNKSTEKGLKEQEALWKRLEHAVTGYGRATLRGMDVALGGVNRFQRGLEGAVKSVVNLKNVILGSAIGAGAVGLTRHVLKAGAGDVRNARMLSREFGPGLLRDSVLSQSKSISAAAGIEDDDALVGLLPIARAIRETKIGDKVGGKKIRNKGQLEAVQRAQFESAAQRFKQLAVLKPDMSPEQIGFLLSEAGQGEEGLRGLGRALNLGKASMGDIMRDAKKSKSGVGDTIGAMFTRAGFTDSAVKTEQGSFEFQAKQLGTAIETSMGDIGAKAIERLNERLGAGKSLADRWGEVMEKNKDTIDKLANGLATVVEKAMELAEKLPAAFSWIQEHSTTLLSVAGAYAGLKVIGGVRNLVGSSLGGAGKILDAVKGDEGQKVFITNWPASMGGGAAGGLPGAEAAAKAGGKAGKLLGVLGKAAAVAGVGIAAYEGMTALDEATGGAISGGAADAAGWVTGQDGRMAKEEQAGTGAHADRLGRAASERRQRIAMLEQRGISHGEAVFAADNATSAAGMATAKKAGINMNMNGMVLNISTALGQTPAQIAKGLMPDLLEQITRALTAQVPVK
jgi:hypothetical protein